MFRNIDYATRMTWLQQLHTVGLETTRRQGLNPECGEGRLGRSWSLACVSVIT